MPNTFEIYGTGVHNLGAMLMAEAINDRLRMRYSEVEVAVGAGFGNAQARGSLGLKLVDDVPGRAAGPYMRILPSSLREILGVIRAESVTALLDASGYAYADAFGVHPAGYLLSKMGRASRKDQRLILMPQAFGPFDNPNVAKASKSLLQRADLVYARDPESQRLVNELIGGAKAKLSPDITIALDAANSLPDDWDIPERFVAIVPNFRMQKRSSDPGGTRYLQVLQSLISKLESAQIPVRIVLHSLVEDVELAKKLSSMARNAPIVSHKDPLVLKAFLARAHFVIGSRFHALVSALSQGVPSLGLGWAHKYEWLFRDFGVPEYLVPIEDVGTLGEKLNALIDPSSNSALRSLTIAHSQELRLQVESMWDSVFASTGPGKL